MKLSENFVAGSNDVMHAKKKYDFIQDGSFLATLLISPALLIIFVVMIIPLIYGLIISMFDYQIGQADLGKFLFFGNYARLIHDGTAISSLFITLRFTAGALLTELVMGILISVLLLQIPQRAGAILRAVYSMPLLISPIIVGLIWRYMLDPTYGIIYQFLNLFGLGQYFGGLSSSSWSLICIIMADVWETTPFAILVATSGIVSISNELYEAGRIDGAGGFRLFFNITLPLIKRVIVVICLIRGVDAFRVFDIIYALTGGGPANSTLSLSIFSYQQGFVNYQMGYAMSISIMTMIILFALFGPILKSSSEN